MQMSSQKDGDYLIVRVSERLDAMSTPDFEASCNSWIDKGHSNLILDLSGLEYVSSAGLRSIMATAKKVKRAGGGLSLCGLSGLVEEVMVVSGFDRILPTFPNADAALTVA